MWNSFNANINKIVSKVTIRNFKIIEDEEFTFKNLTILTGENGSGKTSLIQSILLAGNQYHNSIRMYLDSLGIRELFNYNYNNDVYVTIEPNSGNCVSYKINKASMSFTIDNNTNLNINFLTYPDNLVYLNAFRQGLFAYSNFNQSYNVREFGIFGEMAVNYYEHNKRNLIEDYLVKDNESYTLEQQLNYWLSYITNNNVNFYSEKINFSQIQNGFIISGNFHLPQNTGTGFSYLFSILVSCLSAKRGNIIIIENPEIHLHPKSQAKLGEFFAFIASKGIQLIIETHNDHIINKICYEIYKNSISKDDVIIHYFSIPYKKTTIYIDSKGHFINKQGEPTQFPEGFFDATLKEVFEMNEDI